MKYWLLKSEPESFSLNDLKRAPRATTCWDGVRNYQARNMLRDEMKRGDLASFITRVASCLALSGSSKSFARGIRITPHSIPTIITSMPAATPQHRAGSWWT